MRSTEDRNDREGVGLLVPRSLRSRGTRPSVGGKSPAVKPASKMGDKVGVWPFRGGSGGRIEGKEDGEVAKTPKVEYSVLRLSHIL